MKSKHENLLSSQIFMHEPNYARRVYPDLGRMVGYGYEPNIKAHGRVGLMLGSGNDLESTRHMMKAICKTIVDDDGMRFNGESVTTERISEDADYQGVRAKFVGTFGTARCPIQVDLGFSDIVTPGPVVITYPTILDLPAPRLRAYNRETAIAEKFEAMVKLGELNSRMKDFFDLWALAAGQTFIGPIVLDAVRATFTQQRIFPTARRTLLPCPGSECLPRLCPQSFFLLCREPCRDLCRDRGPCDPGM